MSEFEEQPVVPDQETPRNESLHEGEGPKSNEAVDFSSVQAKGEALLKAVESNGDAQVDRLGLTGNPEAKKASERYNSQRKSIGDRVKEKLALIATVGALTFGGSPAEASQIENRPLDSLGQTELSIQAKDATVENQTSQEEFPAVGRETLKMSAEENEKMKAVEKRAKNEASSSEQEADSKELRELNQMASDIKDECLGLQKDNCLSTIARLALKDKLSLERVIPVSSIFSFGDGFSKIEEAFTKDELSAGERFGKAVSGVFGLVTDAAMLHIGGPAVIKLAQLYRSYKTVDNVKGAYALYEKNKDVIHTALGRIFQGSPAEQKAVEEVLVTLKKVGDTTKGAPRATEAY